MLRTTHCTLLLACCLLISCRKNLEYGTHHPLTRELYNAFPKPYYRTGDTLKLADSANGRIDTFLLLGSKPDTFVTYGEPYEDANYTDFFENVQKTYTDGHHRFSFQLSTYCAAQKFFYNNDDGFINFFSPNHTCYLELGRHPVPGVDADVRIHQEGFDAQAYTFIYNHEKGFLRIQFEYRAQTIETWTFIP